MKRALLCAAVLPLLCTAAHSRDSTARLKEEVQIRRDTYGVPHILARTEEAAAFGFGYAQAEDHCVEIARRYVAARGEQARTFGTGLDSDFLVKLYDSPAESARDLQRVGSVYRAMVAAYAAGFNLYVEQHRSELPGWIPRFTGADVMAQRRSGAIQQVHSAALARALAAKYPAPGSVPRAAPQDPPELEEADGSNAFALGGSRTVSGHPILLGNPHLAWSSLYWEAHVTVPGKVDFFGSTLAGIPVLRAGFNERLGWVTTNNAPDLTDVFALEMDPDRPDHYRFAGKSRPLVRRDISVEVRGADGRPRTETRTYWESHLGKIVHRTPQRAFAVRSTLLDAARYYEGFYLLSKTRNLRGFLASMKQNLVPTSNFAYADADGNVAYLWNARVPERREDGTDYKLDVPARDGRYVWKRVLKASRLPRLVNPAGGYIQNCNNPPWFTSLRDPIDARRYPPYLEEERGLALRPQMALALLESRPRFSLEDVLRMKFDTTMLVAERVKPDLLEALRAARGRSEDLDRGLAALEAWDNHVSGDSRGAVLFQRFWNTYSAARREPYAKAWSAAAPGTTPAGLADPRLALEHLEEAVRWTRRTYGSESVAWGDVHRFRFGAADLPGDGADGSYGLFRVVRFNPAADGKRLAGQVKEDEPPVGFGDAWVLAVEFSRPVKAFSILAYGQTTRSSSPHSSDQGKLYARHEYKPVWFTDAEIRAHLEREYHP